MKLSTKAKATIAQIKAHVIAKLTPEVGSDKAKSTADTIATSVEHHITNDLGITAANDVSTKVMHNTVSGSVADDVLHGVKTLTATLANEAPVANEAPKQTYTKPTAVKKAAAKPAKKATAKPAAKKAAKAAKKAPAKAAKKAPAKAAKKASKK